MAGAHLGDLGVRAQHRARALGGAREGRHDPTRVDRVVVGDVEREADGRREGRLQAAGARREEALGAQAEPLAQRELARERLGLVAVARDEQRALRAVAHVEPAHLPQLLREARPAACALEAEAQERLLAGVGLADRREHAGRDVRGAAAELAAVEHADAQPARTRAPGRRQPDEAAADDRYVEGSGVVADRSAPRFAGMTRISS